MRKISKIKLKDFHEMDEMEMRNIIGGSGGTGGSGGSSSYPRCNKKDVKCKVTVVVVERA